VAFDQITRNRLQRFVNEARNLLTEEFTRQLQRDYGIDPKTGGVADIAKLSDLDDRRLETAKILREIAAHYLATESASGQAADRQVLDRIVREQAFTVLNRLAALRMAEARGLLIESVGNGYQAKGFQLYARLAVTGLGETGESYRTYLFSVFDELARDLPSLFDRYTPQGLLFPREAALLSLLRLINDPEIESLWAEDETIGWVYQYFNSKEERKAMREASQAPRNSRELAVRNQFFTPRYVVEFLVDNTLGRLWFNATGGQTVLRDRCQYLLVKPDEQPPAAARLRDPRTLKLLDPACGSMHFGLYAFDLFLDIYREAWAWEQEHGPGSLDVSTQPEAELRPLSQTYPDEAAFLQDVPRLIIEHNLYGVDIDPRAAQIASLALWLRAQRAWHDAGVKGKERPSIGRGNVVAAVAPPAERELRQQFSANLDQRDAELFGKTLQLLKGLPELGVLLQVEKELPTLIRQVYGGTGSGLFAREEQETWQRAETRLREALTQFALAAQATYQGRLFARDALQGLRLIDLCRELFDVVVMNPPFGLATREKLEQIRESYPDGWVDLYACFVSRAVQLCSGWVGVISSRSLLITKKLERLRSDLVVPRFERLLDLGWPVMDDATVQSAAYTLNCTRDGPDDRVIVIDRKPYSDKANQLASIASRLDSSADCYFMSRATIERLPKSKILYNLPSNTLRLFLKNETLGDATIMAKVGMKTANDFRFVRLRSEVKSVDIGRGRPWVPFAKGGGYSVFYSDLPLVVNWGSDGAEICEINRQSNGQTAQARQGYTYYYLSGGTYSYRAKDFGVRVLPEGFIFSGKGIVVFPAAPDCDPGFVVGMLNARLFKALINLQANAKQYDKGIVESLPFVAMPRDQQASIRDSTLTAVKALRLQSQRIEGNSLFVCPEIKESLSEMVQCAIIRSYAVKEITAASLAEINRIVDSTYQVDSRALENVLLGEKTEDDGAPNVSDGADDSGEDEEDQSRASRTPSELAFELVSYAFGCAIGRWDIRYATGEMPLPEMNSAFAALPVQAPGILRKDISLTGLTSYPLSLPPAGMLVDDEGHGLDVVERIRNVLRLLWRSSADDIEQEIATALFSESLRQYICRPSAFFSEHLALYTKSKRKSPIYWPLSTASGTYTLWIYYPSLTSQTLYSAINDFVEPKLKDVGEQVASLRAKGSDRTRQDEKQFEALQAFELELIELRDTLLKIAPTYRPNHDDGVQITAAPLWPLFRHKPWQKVLKDTWAKLEKGDYDWAHLAMNYWPARVRDKCETDKSLAIAHGLEELYVEPQSGARSLRGRKKRENGDD